MPETKTKIETDTDQLTIESHTDKTKIETDTDKIETCNMHTLVYPKTPPSLLEREEFQNPEKFPN